MKDMKTAPFLQEMIRTIEEMYRHGWDERNGGNVSLLLTEAEVADYVDVQKVLRVIPIGFCSPTLANRYFLVTGSGKYFRNVPIDPEKSLGLLRIAADGEHAELLWGYSDGGQFTSEFPAHMMSHAIRLAINPKHRVIMHCHPVNLMAMTYVHDLDERAFTRTLWRMNNENVVVFPEGVNVLPWMRCGTVEIGEATAEKMKTARMVMWAMHGIFGAGNDLDEAFGLIETAEKGAEIYMKIAHLPWVNIIEDDQLRAVAAVFGITPREGYLD